MNRSFVVGVVVFSSLSLTLDEALARGRGIGSRVVARLEGYNNRTIGANAGSNANRLGANPSTAGLSGNAGPGAANRGSTLSVGGGQATESARVGEVGSNVAGARGGVPAAAGRVGNPTQVAAIRHGFSGHHTYFTPAWHTAHPGAWVAAGIAVGRWWQAPTWNSTSAYSGASEEPASYAYGETVAYHGDTVYYGNLPVTSADRYYQQAVQIADQGTELSNEEWLPLGVFAVVTEGQTQPEKTLQLAVNKAGAIRGNVFDSLADSVVPVQGAVDKKSQRVALRLTGKPDLVAECGLWNLTQDSLTLLVHFGPERTETRGLIRLRDAAL